MSGIIAGCLLGGEPPASGGDPCCFNIGFYAYRNLNQTLSSGLETVINFTNKLATESPVGVFSLAADTFTAPNDGRYSFTSGIEVTVAARGTVFLRCYVNGVYNGSASDESSIAGTVTPNYALDRWLFAGDTVQMRAYQNSGFASTMVGCCNQLWFSGHAAYAI